MNQKVKEFILAVLKDIFIVSFFTLLIFFILENLKKGFITNYINTNILLVICFLSGITVVILCREKEVKEKKKGLKFYFLIGFISFLGMFIVWWYLRDEEWLGWLAPIAAGIILFLIQWSISDNEAWIYK